MHAVAAVKSRFVGFPRPAFELLAQLAENNNRAWFAAHRPALEALVVRPALDLVVDLGPLLRRQVSQAIRAEPRVGGSILRLRHDARYAREDPFRTHVELWFWEGRGPSHQHPGFFVRLTADQLVLGAGITSFPAGMLERYRAAVDEPHAGRNLAGIVHRLERGGWAVEGHWRRRVPAPYPPNHERADLLRRTGLRVARAERLPEAVHGPGLAPLIASGLARVSQFHRWLAEIDE